MSGEDSTIETKEELPSNYDPFNPRGVPPIPRHKNQIIGYPGEVVLENIQNDTPTDGSFEFTLRKVTAGVDTKISPEDAPNLPHGKVHYAAITPYRAVVWTGDTPGAALGCMLKGLAEYSRSGSLNPDHPTQMGVPPIQHVLEILSERMIWQVDRRREKLTQIDDLFQKDSDSYWLQQIAKDNEVISALATSIAALARVKDL
jgi:hypothetical protein